MPALIASGAAFGFASALSPGPLLLLILTQSIRHGRAEGMKVAVAPLCTDAFMIVVALALVSSVAASGTVLGALSLFGAAVILFFAAGCFRARRFEAGSGASASAPRSFLKGISLNLLSPYPYLFWTLVGAPLLLQAYRDGGAPAAAVFLAAFFLTFVGLNLTCATVAGRARGFLGGRSYEIVMRLLGCVLAVFAVMRAADGIRMLREPAKNPLTFGGGVAYVSRHT